MSSRLHLAAVLLNIDVTVCHVANSDRDECHVDALFQLKNVYRRVFYCHVAVATVTLAF